MSSKTKISVLAVSLSIAFVCGLFFAGVASADKSCCCSAGDSSCNSATHPAKTHVSLNRQVGFVQFTPGENNAKPEHQEPAVASAPATKSSPDKAAQKPEHPEKAKVSAREHHAKADLPAPLATGFAIH